MRDALTSSLVERRCGCKRCIADLLSDRPGHQPSNDVACDNATNSTIDLGLRGYFRCDRANCCTIKKNRWPSRTFQQNPHMFCSELISNSGKTFLRPTQTDRADCAPKCSEIGSPCSWWPPDWILQLLQCGFRTWNNFRRFQCSP